MDLNQVGAHQPDVRHPRRLISAVLAAGAVILVASIVACGNSAQTGPGAPAPSATSNTPAPSGVTGNGASVGGDNVPPPSAPLSTSSTTTGNGLEPLPAPTTPSPGPTSPTGPTPGPTPTTPQPSPDFLNPSAGPSS